MSERVPGYPVTACLDTNVLISALLASTSTAAPSQIVQRMLARSFKAVIAEPTIRELQVKVQTKPYLATRISAESVNDLIDLLMHIAEVVPIEDDLLQPITRDPRDDYLLAPAIRARVDYVVSGDNDLLMLGEVAGVKILSPAAFLHLLDVQADRSPQ